MQAAFEGEMSGQRIWRYVLVSVTYDGKPSDTTKHTYNQAFAIYALSSYYDATGNKEALEIARCLQKVIEDRCTDEYGYLEAFNRKFEPEEKYAF